MFGSWDCSRAGACPQLEEQEEGVISRGRCTSAVYRRRAGQAGRYEPIVQVHALDVFCQRPCRGFCFQETVNLIRITKYNAALMTLHPVRATVVSVPMARFLCSKLRIRHAAVIHFHVPAAKDKQRKSGVAGLQPQPSWTHRLVCNANADMHFAYVLLETAKHW